MNLSVRAFVLLVAFFTSGCATVMSEGGQQKLTFNSEPAEATVIVAGRVIGKTPVSASVKRGKDTPITIEKEGYKTHTAELSTTLNGWFWGNILIGGLLGSTTDGATGAIHEYAPNKYFVTLVPTQPFGVESSRPRDVKELWVASGAQIRTQIANGGGEHVDALFKLLEVPDTGKAQALEAVKKTAAESPDDLEVAKKLIEVYGVK